jgi:hypothetical protein
MAKKRRTERGETTSGAGHILRGPTWAIGCNNTRTRTRTRKTASGSVIRDEQPGSYFFELRKHFFGFFGVKILKFFDEDPGSGMETVRIRDGEKSDPG